MVRKTNMPVPPAHSCPARCLVHHVIIEVKAFAALRNEIQVFSVENQVFCDENQLLRECLAALEDEWSRTQPTPPPVPTPPIPAQLLILFKELKIAEPLTFDGKAYEFRSFLHQCKLYIRMKSITFKEHDDKSHIAFIISPLYGISTEWHQALFESNSPLPTDYDTFFERLVALYQNR